MKISGTEFLIKEWPMKKAKLFNIFKIISTHLATYCLLLTSFAPMAVMAQEGEPEATATPAPTVDMTNMTEADIQAMNEADPTTADVAAAAIDDNNNGNSNLGEVDTTTSQWIAIISGIVIGYLSARLVAACKKKTYDVYLAAAAGVVYIYGEIKATMEDKETREEIEDAYDKCKNQEADCQTGALEAEMASYDEIQKTAEDKAKLHTYSAMGLAAAAAWALGKGLYRASLATTCTTAIATGAAAASSSGTATCAALVTGAAACEAEVVACVAASGAAEFSVTEAETFALTPQPSETQAAGETTAATTGQTSLSSNCNGLGSAAQMAAAKSACMPYFTNIIAEETVCSVTAFAALADNNSNRYGPEPVEINNLDKMMKQYFDIKVANNKDLDRLIPNDKKRSEFKEFWRKAYFEGMDIFSPTAFAGGLGGFSSYMGFGGAAIGIWYGMKKATATSFDMFIGSPYGRATFFGAMSAIVYYSATVTQDIADQAKSNSDKIKSVISGFRDDSEGTEIERQGRERQDVVTTTGTTTAAGNTAVSDTGGVPEICANGANASGGCNAIPGATAGDTSFLNGFLGSNGASGLMQVANDANNGSLSPSSNEIVNGSGAQGAIAMKNLRKAKADFMGKLKKKDEKAFDRMSKLDNYAQKSIQAGVMKVLKKNNATPGQFLAAVGTGEMPSSKDAGKNKRIAAISNSISGKKVGSVSIGGSDKSSKAWKMNFDFDDKAKEEVTAVSGNGGDLGLSEDNGTTIGSHDADDIIGRNQNIFDEITKRYIRTAYPVLLDRL
tara:strand:+ start:38586 stop:40946 length:2361 start_codon:yes stop_codon:yes gene_type:complete